MVVNKKQSIPPAPPMGSRTNSSQPLTRQKNATNSKLSPPAGPSTSSTVSSSSSQKHKHKKHSKATNSTNSSFKDKLVFIFLSIFTLYALTTCPSDISLSNPVCRSLSQYRTHVLEPYVLPPIHKALSHPSLAPAVSRFHAAERAVTPVVIRAHAIARPYIAKVTQYSQKTAQATFNCTVLPIYRRYVSPRVQLFQVRVIEPYIAPYGRKAEIYANKAILTLHRFLVTVKPRIQVAYVRARPHAERAWDTARPHLLKAVEAGAAGLGLAMEKSAEARRQYVDPHVIRIWEKVVELSGTSSTVSTGTTVAATATSTKVKEETKATPVEVEPETTESSTLSSASYTASLSVSNTPSVISVVSESSSETASPFVPEEPVVPVETLTETPQVDEATLSSAASVIHESVAVSASNSPDFDTSLLSEVSSSASSVSSVSDSSPVVPTTPPTAEESSTLDVESAEFIAPAAPSAVEETSPEPEAEPQAEADPSMASKGTDDDLDSFFADIGFEEEQMEEEDPELGSDDHVSVEDEAPAMNSEEAKEAHRIATAEKRAKIEARMEKWTVDLQALVKKRAKQVRKELVRVRKGAVRGLFPDPKGDNSDLEETLTHVRGEDVAGMLGRLEVEGDKLLKGLESYLKKEEKVLADSTGKDPDDRLKRWDNLVQRVEDKFVERMTEMQEKIHWWYLEVRELEVQEYHAATAEVKSLAEKAQGDVGLDLAWLDDVTYNDWQKYHDYMRMYERFDEQVRLIQNGSHPSPPIDPLVPALDKLQVELEDLVSGFKGQIRSFSGRMRDLLTPPAEKSVDVEGVEGESGIVGTSGDEESALSEQGDEVRILPIDPVATPPSVEEFDPGTIVIGKSKEQVEEAMKAAQGIHEEL